MQLRSRQDFWSGLMFVALGLGFAWQASDYPMGTAERMGPGYFPFWLGILLSLAGAVVLLGALSPSAAATRVERFDWRIVILVIGSVVGYGLILKPLGIYVSVFVLVVASSLASHEFSLRVAIGNAIFLVAFSYLAFVRGLGLALPLWPAFTQAN
jgi:hypothetical protein